jgi:hypothetical protein
MMGKPMLSDPVDIAGAYLLYLFSNLPEEKLNADAWERLDLDVASSVLDREQTTARLRKLLRARK